ncbi:MAG TPA: allantoate amidohydrolase [Streptosporangiaceae bacterium]|nr:allantoate amidohydrolase [Streptosporangiaceae bacterium]
MARTWENSLWQSLLPLGRDGETGGYRRYSFTAADSACRDWFVNSALQRNLRTESDRNGNLWAWWDAGRGAGGEAAGAIAVGSHLDSVPDGGAFDGPLGVVSAFLAVDLVRARGFEPVRPIAVAAFTEEEGARFGRACLGSRLSSGVIDAASARGLTDADGVTLAEAMTSAGLDPARIGPDPQSLARIAAFVELHIEQGSALGPLGAAIGIAESIWPHGRWRIDFEGRADHAGTTRLADRRDPMLAFAATVLGARQAAEAAGGLATMSKVVAVPGGTNGINSAVRAWLDARAPDDQALTRLTGQVMETARAAGVTHRVTVSAERESLSPLVEFDVDLRDRLMTALARQGMAAPVLPTGAGHDAGVLAGVLPTAMLFVRNPSGISHSPAEYATPEDCEAGVEALAFVLEELAGR